MPQCLIVDSSSFGNGEGRGASGLWLDAVLTLCAAIFLIYAETWAFTSDEAYRPPRVPAGSFPADDARHSYNVMYYEGTRVPATFFMLQFGLLRRLPGWNWGRRNAVQAVERCCPR